MASLNLKSDHDHRRLPHRFGSLRAALLMVLSLGGIGERAAYAQSTEQTAANKPAPNAVERAAARQQMSQGYAAEQAGDFTLAEQHYRAAHETMRVPTTGLALARVLAQRGALLEANSVALETAHLPRSPDESTLMEKARTEAQALAAALQPRTPSIHVVVTPAEAEVEVQVDGRPITPALLSAPLPLDPGSHQVVVSGLGFAPYRTEVRLGQGKHEQLPVTLQAQAVGTAAVRAAPPQALAAHESDDDHLVRGFVGVGVGGAALAVGAVASVMSAGRINNVKDRCGGTMCPLELRSELEADVDSAQTLALVSNIVIPVGVVALGYGLYELLLNQPPDERRATGQLNAQELRVTF